MGGLDGEAEAVYSGGKNILRFACGPEGALPVVTLPLPRWFCYLRWQCGVRSCSSAFPRIWTKKNTDPPKPAKVIDSLRLPLDTQPHTLNDFT